MSVNIFIKSANVHTFMHLCHLINTSKRGYTEAYVEVALMQKRTSRDFSKRDEAGCAE